MSNFTAFSVSCYGRLRPGTEAHVFIVRRRVGPRCRFMSGYDPCCIHSPWIFLDNLPGYFLILSFPLYSSCSSSEIYEEPLKSNHWQRSDHVDLGVSLAKETQVLAKYHGEKLIVTV